MKSLLLLALTSVLLAQGPAVVTSQYSKADFALTADPNAPHWKNIKGVIAAGDRNGQPVPGHRTEIRTRWTDKNIYFLFVAPYEELHLKPNPVQASETNKLWEYDVAEVFVGSDYDNIGRYKEFEISPQGEWVDLDINRGAAGMTAGWEWNSGFENKARIDRDKKIWYGEMRIPLQSIDSRAPKNGLEMRVNLYRCQGSGATRKYIAWQPVGSQSFHNPKAFGTLRLAGK